MMRLTKLAMALLLCAATSVAQQQIAFTWNDLPAQNALPPGALDARLLPRLIQVYRSHGIQFVSLEEATKDPFYRNALNPRLNPVPDSLEEAMRKTAPRLRPRPSMDVNLDTTCRADTAQPLIDTGGKH